MLPTSGDVRIPPMLRSVYVDSTPHIVPGGELVNLLYAARSSHAPRSLAQRVSEFLGITDGENAGGETESDKIKLSVARAIVTDPDLIVMNAENMTRGDWILRCFEDRLTALPPEVSAGPEDTTLDLIRECVQPPPATHQKKA